MARLVAHAFPQLVALVRRWCSAPLLRASRSAVVPRSGRTLSSLPPGATISLAWASKPTAGGAPKQPPSSACPSHFAGRPSCPSLPHVALQPACSAFPWPVLAMLMATCPSSAICSRTRLTSFLSPATCPDGPWTCGFQSPSWTIEAVWI